MFRKFDPSSDVSTSTQVKASVQRAIKSQILNANPELTDEILDELLPKKPPLVQYKVGPHLMLYCRYEESDQEGVSGSEIPVFFQERDGPILPALKFIHQYPSLQFTSVQVDKGAIPFLLGGANCMCPGLTKSPGSRMAEDTEEGPGLNKGDAVIVYAEGKEHAIAVGVMTMSSADVRKENKGIGIEIAHFLGDGLFQTKEIK
eukprot:CAMPEP_0202446088 /NCGR_PEP_ID=MMETSP1360-20130828/4722_1 /ASSEMBLY_ACC=CAM_ASM_000848 /TAXON_ID=515479 /ORGANISM="Licmophora paradoxa, Strain CCMP2313" /LENGTH=202 /DNA_ID=CAMNT_0049062517 /DNA_START=56 /DNA_END=664 /DNA_ORIENTATION=+